MLAHAGTEAVRLVPFSSLLLSETLTLSSDYRSLAWRLPLCQDAVHIIAVYQKASAWALLVPVGWRLAASGQRNEGGGMGRGNREIEKQGEREK